jgi:hypothetical protein
MENQKPPNANLHYIGSLGEIQLTEDDVTEALKMLLDKRDIKFDTPGGVKIQLHLDTSGDDDIPFDGIVLSKKWKF